MRYPSFKEPTAICICWACGGPEPMGCGNICADCSWEEHLESIAHTGHPAQKTHEATPTCCLASHEAHDIEVQDYNTHYHGSEMTL